MNNDQVLQAIPSAFISPPSANAQRSKLLIDKYSNNNSGLRVPDERP